MPDTTPVFGFPFPQDTDPPDSPSQMEALALAVEGALDAVKTAPVGSIVMWPTASAPTGWLICNGSTFSAVTYPALNTLLGGNTLPDMRARFPIGKAASGTGSTLLGTGGAIDHTHNGPSHTHTVAAHTHSTDLATVSSSANIGTVQVQSGTGQNVASNSHDHDVNPPPTTSTGTALTSDAAGAGATGTANPPFLSLNFIIRAV